MNSTHSISVPAQFIALLATALIGATSTTSATAAPLTKDITFATVDGHALKLDLFMPKTVKTNAKKPPLVVFIHGGGWRNGSYKRCHTKWLTEYGFAVASVGYRLTDKAIFPAQVHDCKAAIRWLRAHGADYGYDATRIGVAGTSAGGYLALMMGVTGKASATNKAKNDRHELEGKVGEYLDQSSAVHAIVDYYGPSDFVLRSQNQPSKTESKDGSVYKLLGGPASKNLALAKLASPVFHVTKDDPPLLIIHGEKDTTVKPDQAKRMAEAYGQLKLDITLESAPGGGHGGSMYFKGKYRDIVAKFLRTHLMTTKKSNP